ncbi:MAG TPA: hypothetical protein VMU58_01410 [Gaiellaceae bacterium]|nr:hypothetical protein [Gaiellaceae bacterium]
MKARILLVTALAAAALAPSAAAAPGLLLGLDDDSLKWYSHTGSLLSIYSSLGVGAVRVTLDWRPGESFPAGTDRTELQRAANAGRRIRVVLAVTGPASAPPLDDAARASYCGFAANVLRRYPWIHDVAIWTEPNSSTFWQPRKGSAAAYEALLATCWDTLHAVQPDANVIATSAPHAKPGKWYTQIGKAYRASGRAQPLFDTVGHNAYPESSAEAPGARHTGNSIDEGDLDRLLASLHTAFDGTGQPVPGTGGVTVWYMEDGFQSTPAADAGLYTGVETDRHPVSEDVQASQLATAVRLAYCQPAVGGFFNFELRDDSGLAGWQSGLLRPDWSAKPAFLAYLQAIAAARTGAVSCPEH